MRAKTGSSEAVKEMPELAVLAGGSISNDDAAGLTETMTELFARAPAVVVETPIPRLNPASELTEDMVPSPAVVVPVKDADPLPDSCCWRKLLYPACRLLSL